MVVLPVVKEVAALVAEAVAPAEAGGVQVA